MAKGYDIKRNHNEIKEIQQRLEGKKDESSKLEQQKRELIDAMMNVEGANLDAETIAVVRESINASLEANSEKGRELSVEMNDDIKSMEAIKQDTMDSIGDAQKQKDNIQKKQKLLERFGLGSHLDKASSELTSNMQEMGELNTDTIATMNDAMKIAQKLGGL